MNKTSLTFALLILILFTSCTKPKLNNTTTFNVLKRTIGEDASRFVFSLEEAKDTLEWFEIEVKQNRIYVKGNSEIALSKGAYHYIKENNFGVVTWEGTNVKIPAELGDDKTYKRRTTSLPYRMYINPCTYGYTMAWWTWERWEQELDWMALHGINMPLALLGQEIIWQEVWEDMGIDKSKLSDYHCGPAFLPWFRMGNLYDHKGPLPQNWMEKDKTLQQKILKRMKALGMKPILPAFSGHVPNYFKNVYPQAKVYELKNWGGVPAENASLLLDPKDSLFTTIGKLFLEKYESTYGTSDLFLADAFNEMHPPVSQENKNMELAEYGEAIYSGLKEYNPNATWVIQGWTFGHQRDFWTPEATKSFFSRIPHDNMMMLNYGEDRYSIWEDLDAFYGFKWTYGYVHNYGGQQSLFGDFKLYYDKYKNLINNPSKKNLVGYGCLPEAIENNSIIYEYIFDIPWGATDHSVNDWINSHLSNRYGKLTPQIKEAWEIAVKNTYTVKEWRLQTKSIGYGTYIHNNRPTLDIGANGNGYKGNPDSIKTVLELLIEAYKSNKSELLYYDIIDFAQHYTAYKADFHLIKATEQYLESDFINGDIEFNKTKDYLEKLEVLQVETGGSFTKWCEDAVSLSTTEEEKALYLKNAKTQISIWGGNRLKDYASKSWSGILMDFYVPRWQMLFDDVKENKQNFDILSAQNKIREWEEAWTLEPSIPKSPEKLQKEEYIKFVKEIIELEE